MENCHVDVQNKLEVVRPATEVYAQEAIEALKAGKVIAVPTDTLYGFACDAWYGNFDSFRFTICLIPLNYDFLILKCPRKFKCYFLFLFRCALDPKNWTLKNMTARKKGIWACYSKKTNT